MKRTSSTKTPAVSDDVPVLTAANFKRAKYRVAGTAATKAEWQAAVQEKVGKQRISIMLDAPIIAHFKAAAGERGHQTLINDALRRVVEGAGWFRKCAWRCVKRWRATRSDNMFWGQVTVRQTITSEVIACLTFRAYNVAFAE